MKRKSSHDSLTGKELAEIILRLIDNKNKAPGSDSLLLDKICNICQDVVDEW